MVCECCLSPRAPLELSFPYVHRGAREIYGNMLLECFGLQVPSSGHICNTCVSQLRSAVKFRRRVSRSQSTLARQRSVHQSSTVSRADAVAKVEAEVKLEEDSNCGFDDFGTELHNDDEKPFVIKKEPTHDWSSDDDDSLLTVAKNKPTKIPLKTIPTKKIVIRTKTDPQLRKELGKLNFAKHKLRWKIKTNLDAELNTFRRLKVMNGPKANLIDSTTTILTCSNATPFHGKSPSGYRCFYCTQYFTQPDLLREHTRKDHIDEKHETILSKYSAGTYMVYFDVKDLACKLCLQTVNNIDELRSHLAKEHGKTHTISSDRNIPFVLPSGNECKCVKCEEKFQTFGSLERHMNIHYRNYTCQQCGAGYITHRRVQAHEKLSHTLGVFPCVCGKTFSSQIKLKQHEDTVHKQLARFKCPHCGERFCDYYKRQAHLVSEHNAKPLVFKCDICEVTFGKKNGLSRHTKKFHLQELNFSCEICSYRCFSSNEMKTHMIKHTGARVHECGVCKKAYARKKTLREHMRIHNNDRRFVCAVCSQAFVQNCSLKGHMKTHHSEVFYT